MESQLKDEGCKTLFRAYRNKQESCVLREDFHGASLAKAQAIEVIRLGKQLDACRALAKATLDSNKMEQDIDLDDADAVRKIRNQKDQKRKRDVMREREEEAILKKLDEMRGEAVANSRAVGVLVGLDSFLSTKKQAKERKMVEEAAVERAGMIGLDGGGVNKTTPSTLSNLSARQPQLHGELEYT